MSSSQGEGTVFGHRGITLLRALSLLVSGAALAVLVMIITLVPQLSCGETFTTVGVGKNPKSIAVNPVTNKVYVPNFYGESVDPDNPDANTVSVINGNTFDPITTLPVGTWPSAVAVNASTNKIYVMNQESSGNGTVTVIDGNTDTVVGLPVEVEYFPNAIAVNSNPLINKVYVANSYSGSVTVIDGATNKTRVFLGVGTYPIAIAVNPVTNKVYVVCGDGNVRVIDGVTDVADLNHPVPVGLIGTFDPSPTVIVVNPSANKVYVANELSDNVTVIDGATNTATTITAPSGQVWDAPKAIAVNTVTNKVYVANRDSNNVTVIDGSNITTLTAPSGQTWAAPYAVAVNENTNKVYVANRGSDNVTVIDGATNTTTTLSAAPLDPVWDAPRGIAVNPSTNKAFVANELSNNVTVIQNFYSVTITKSGSGAGTVTSSRLRINCGTTCSAVFPESPSVVMFQTPEPSSGFSGWGGACSGTGDCAFSMLSDKAVSAVFVSEPLVKNQNTGVAYGILQDAYNEAKDNHVISARSALTAPGLNLNKATILTIEGGYNADYSSCTGLTTVLGRVNVGLAPLFVRGLAIKVAP